MCFAPLVSKHSSNNECELVTRVRGWRTRPKLNQRRISIRYCLGIASCVEARVPTIHTTSTTFIQFGECTRQESSNACVALAVPKHNAVSVFCASGSNFAIPQCPWRGWRPCNPFCSPRRPSPPPPAPIVASSAAENLAAADWSHTQGGCRGMAHGG